jgi:hypothetical protein
VVTQKPFVMRSIEGGSFLLKPDVQMIPSLSELAQMAVGASAMADGA